MPEYDYVIVGGGTAGSVMAYRLAEKGNSVCVLEAGPVDKNLFINVPAGFVKTLVNPDLTWQMAFEGSAGTNGRAIPFIQGKTLGGSSSVNGLLYSRGQPLDYDTWESMGNPGWGFKDVERFFRVVERFSGIDEDNLRGKHGLMPVGDPGWRNPSTEAFIESAVEAGIPRNGDYNGKEQFGIGYSQSMIESNRRCSAAKAYLRPAQREHKVKVLTESLVRKLIVKNGRATGVLVDLPGNPSASIFASKAVIVSAGSVGSPKLLQLSGIGPARLLQSLQIPLVKALEGVGENLQDHFAPRIVVRARPNVDSMNQRVQGVRLLREIALWAMGRPSVLATSPNVIYGFGKSTPDIPSADFALSFSPANQRGGVIGHLDKHPGFTCGAWSLRPKSKGYVRIVSTDVGVSPQVQPNFLQHPEDQRITVVALRWARRVMHGGPMQALVESELLPGKDVQTDDELLDYARQHGSTGYHLTGTCRMGPESDAKAVVDSRLAVHGINGLYVIDASVMPASPSANTCAPTLMIAEKAAEMLCSAPPA